ncbi:MAG: hypothetical protein Q9226_002958 [Calogaya cf. arnoldii]
MPAKSRHKPLLLTYDASLKQKAKQNSESSPLLCLPFEGREKIYKELPGDRLLHIEHIHWQHAESPPDPIANWPDLELCDRCQLSCIECLCGEIHNPQDEQIGNGCTLLCTAHLQRSTWERNSPELTPESRSVIRKPNSRGLDKTTLRCCRQIYNESHQVLYTRNTFSFNNPRVFLRFMQTIHTTNLRQIRSLQLYVNTDVNDMWLQASNYVMSMQGLRSLDLIGTTNDNVKVVVKQDARGWDNSWTKQDIETIAGILRDKIGDPNGAKSHIEEHEQRQQARDRRREEEKAEKEEKRQKRRGKETEKGARREKR